MAEYARDFRFLNLLPARDRSDDARGRADTLCARTHSRDGDDCDRIRVSNCLHRVCSHIERTHEARAWETFANVVGQLDVSLRCAQWRSNPALHQTASEPSVSGRW